MTIMILNSLLFASLGSAALGWTMFLLSVFLILLVLVQRGKGGGLTGALGGPGGQSAFGSKAGDTFTLITAVSAIIWGLVCAIAMYTLGTPPLTADDLEFAEDTPSVTVPGDTQDSVPPLGGTPDAGANSGAGGLSGLSGLLSEEADDATEEPEDAAAEPADAESPAMPAEAEAEPDDPAENDEPASEPEATSKPSEDPSEPDTVSETTEPEQDAAGPSAE